MAYEALGRLLPGVVCTDDLRTKQYYMVKLHGTEERTVVLAGDGDAAIGVLQNKPNDGEAAEVCYTGVTKVVSGGSVATGDALTADANGKAEPADSGDFIVGYALEAGATADTLMTMVLVPSGRKA